MSQNKYWKSFGEQQRSEEWKKAATDEFREELPFEDFDSGKLLDAQSPRRDFLKYLGFSTAAAALAASCKQPVKKAIPYAVKPDNMVPGIADYYATSYVNNGEVVPIIAKVRDGRPIKVEGNKEYKAISGGTSARVQASVLDLYDMSRQRMPVENAGEKTQQIPTFDLLDKKIGEELAKLAPASIAILSGTVASETTSKIIADFLAKFPGSRHVQYDSISYSGMLEANLASYGQRVIPGYKFHDADVVVSLGADFLGTWLSPIEFAYQYSRKRKVSDSVKTMSKHFQFESMMSTTGGSADERFMHLPSQAGAVANALLAAVSGQAAGLADAKLKAGVEAAAKALNASRGKALVVCGSNDVNVQIVVNAINNAIGANGTTIDWANTNTSFRGSDADMEKLVADMNGGVVKALFVHGVNPAYTWHNAKGFLEGLKKLSLSVAFSEKADETASKCRFIVPDHHFLESWGDARPKAGITSFLQPTIHPLFKTRNWQTSLLKWSGVNTEYAEYFKNYWITKLGSQQAFDTTLQGGLLNDATAPSAAGASFNAAKAAEAGAALAAASAAGKYEVVVYQKVSMGDGRYANNPWLQEMPDPITKATWDNYIMMGAKTADDLNIKFRESEYEYFPPKPLYNITVNGKTVTLPVLVIPGCAPGVLAVAVGYGRAESVGIAAKGAGKDVYPFTSFKNGTVAYTAAATIEKAGGSYKIAQNQVHNYYEDRTETVKERTLKDVLANPKELYNEREKEFAPYGGMKKFREQGTIYPDYAAERAIHWNMNVDLNSCVGCGACVVACNAENNVPVVGKTEVTRGHDMHWIRIDRYFRSKPAGKGDADVDDVDVVFNPTMCQHCDNAPCENVCPVAATNHSTEGLNQMTYNRCIGTRYCANNCPYKVRRFNWADYTGADSFPNNQDAASGLSAVVTEQMMDDLTRMVLNPDVTVRSRGVIEKCSFCVQRLQEGKLNAKKEGRELMDSDIQVACAQACPTNAITFGNIKGANSAVKAEQDMQQERIYSVLEIIHTLPNVNYFAKIRNVDRAINGLEVEHHGGGHHEAAKDEHKKEATKTEAAH
jgi:MoCo/4Fe-4S cofactor protein with predicted Tat translocation signal